MGNIYVDMIETVCLFLMIVAIVLSLIFSLCIYKPNTAEETIFRHILRKRIVVFFLSYIVVELLVYYCIVGRFFPAAGLCFLIGRECLKYSAL